MDKRQQMSGRYNNRRYRQEQYQQNYRPNDRPSNVKPNCDCKKEDSKQPMVADKCLNNLPLAMAWVPMQKWENICDAPSGLANGSIFKDLIKPYCPVLQRRGDR